VLGAKVCNRGDGEMNNDKRSKFSFRHCLRVHSDVHRSPSSQVREVALYRTHTEMGVLT
jgi:hypothetical protein